MKKLLVTLSGLMLVPAAMAAQLDAPAANNQSGAATPIASPTTSMGAYGGLDLAYGEGAGTASDWGLGFGMRAGYFFSPGLALELGVSRLKARSTETGVKAGHSMIWDVAGVLRKPLTNQFNFLGKAGLALINNSMQVNSRSDSRGHQYAALLGAGVNYQYNQRIGLDLMGQATVGDSSAANTIALMLGASYRLNI